VVLGMHRSGTSALTRVLNIVGADLPAELLGATAHNPTGHWELSRVYDLHNQMLWELGGRWDDWRPISTDWLNSPKRFSYIDRIASILTEEFAKSPLFVLKDPRICRLLSLWKEAFIVADIEMRAILPVRNPLDVSQSLLRRGGTSIGRGLLIWLRHVLDAEAGSRDIVRTWTSYNRLLEDWRGCVRKIGGELNVGWPRLHAEAEREVDLFLDKSLRHHSTGANTLDARAGVPALVADAFQIFSDFLKNGETDEGRLALCGIRGRFDDVCSAMIPAVSDELAEMRIAGERRVEALARTEADLKSTNAEIAQLRQHLTDAEQKLMDLEQVHASLATARTEIERLLKVEAARTITEADLVSAKNQLAVVKEQLVEAESRGTAAESERSQLAGQLAEAERKLVEAESRGTVAESERSRLAGQFAEAERKLASMAGSEATLSAVICHLAEVADRLSTAEQGRLEKRRGESDHKLKSFLEAPAKFAASQGQVTSSFESSNTAEFAPRENTAPLPRRQATLNPETTPRNDTGWELAETALVNENLVALASGEPTRDARSDEAQSDVPFPPSESSSGGACNHGIDR
jgi:hypothetical protein